MVENAKQRSADVKKGVMVILRLMGSRILLQNPKVYLIGHGWKCKIKVGWSQKRASEKRNSILEYLEFCI